MKDDWNRATRAIHADEALADTSDVAAPLHLSTTYRRGEETDLTYSRTDTATRRRLEAVLGSLEGGHCAAFASAQAASFAALYHFGIRRVLTDSAYWGTESLFASLGERGVEIVAPETAPRAGDLVWIETPNSRLCQVHDVAAIAARAHAAGALVLVDNTFATPILQNPLERGADVVLHSLTKYVAGHSDAMAGALVVPREADASALRETRTVLGAVPGSLDAWLALRGCRTLALRMERHAANALALATWLEPRVERVWYPFLASHPEHDLARRQMRAGGGVLQVDLPTEDQAKRFVATLELFVEATSFGGVESLAERRAIYDPRVPPNTVRLSVGIEDVADLVADVEAALEAAGG